jgi:hypothetical protein
VVPSAGCRESTNKAGGASQKTVVLTLANHEPDNYEIEQWPAAVEKLSRGSLHIDVRNRWRERDSDYEEHTVADLRAGKIDLAKIGARAWDLVGVTSFQALVAPLLVDSYELELEATDLQELFATWCRARQRQCERRASGPVDSC